MSGKSGLNERAQVSIETLLLAGVIITLSMSVFSYYIQIRDSTIAMELIKVDVLRQIEEAPGQHSIEKIEYLIGADKVHFCILTSPKGAAEELPLDTTKIEAMFADNRIFEGTAIEFHHNPPAPNPCE